MMKKFEHNFVKIIPDNIEPDILYISTEYKTVMHMCPCDCGSEITIPLSPHDWKLTFDGDSVSLYPSVGNWSLPCQSHYWITNSTVKWASTWSREQINLTRKESKKEKEVYYRKNKAWSLFDFFKRRQE